mgnify:CR=1 FL=1
MIRTAALADGPALAEIYNWYIANTVITFEEEQVCAGDMAQRIVVADETRPWLVLEDNSRIIGFACAERWKSRRAYRLARETSVYFDHEHRGMGYGRELYENLINALRQTPIHVLIAGIALPNEQSIALHENLGFEKVGQFREVGLKFGKRIDVGYWQLILKPNTPPE